MNTRLPAVMLAAGISAPAVTPTPESVRLPAAGSVVITTDWSALAGVSVGSVKPKIGGRQARAASSSVVTVVLVPAGASLTAVTLRVTVFALGSRSTPPLAVPPSSCTWKVKLA